MQVPACFVYRHRSGEGCVRVPSYSSSFDTLGIVLSAGREVVVIEIPVWATPHNPDESGNFSASRFSEASSSERVDVAGAQGVDVMRAQGVDVSRAQRVDVSIAQGGCIKSSGGGDILKYAFK